MTIKHVSNSGAAFEYSISDWAAAVLNTADPVQKAAMSVDAARRWRLGPLKAGTAKPPGRPMRPDAPQLMAPSKMPKRSNRGEKGKIALLHAIAHIELNAIDLAWDLIARFGAPDLSRSLNHVDRWVAIAAEEAKHFSMLNGRLRQLGSYYGALPAHDGLWEAAEATSNDLLARLAVVPLSLEARGLDVTPKMIQRLENIGDFASANILKTILQDEIGHVKAGFEWFVAVCAERGQEPAKAYQSIIGERFRGIVKPPFNDSARLAAGLLPQFYGGEVH